MSLLGPWQGCSGSVSQYGPQNFESPHLGGPTEAHFPRLKRKGAVPRGWDCGFTLDLSRAT